MDPPPDRWRDGHGRPAVAADFASPFANAGDQGLSYINSDVTLYLHRLPVKEWIGLEVVNHHATDGVAIGECFLYDQQGPSGASSIPAHFVISPRGHGVLDRPLSRTMTVSLWNES